VKFNFVTLGTILGLLAAPAMAGTLAKPHQPDPLLDGGPASPCMAGPDYQAGVDVNGRAVAPADEQASRVPVPDQIAVPLHSGQTQGRGRGRSGGASPAHLGDSPYVALDGKRLDPLVNPTPCH
jgi:hypothetical protein